MARLPTILSEPARSVMPQSGNPAMGTPNEFGAQIGEAEVRVGREQEAASLALGSAVVGAGVAFGNLAQDAEEKAARSATASGVANFDFTKDYIDLQKAAPPDGMSYQEAVANRYDEKVDKYLEGMPNDEVRNRVREKLVVAKKGYIEAAAQYQNQQAIENDKLQADSGLQTQLNGVRADGSIDKYNDAIVKGNDIIDTRPDLSPQTKAKMKKGYAEQLAMRRFEGLIAASSTDPDALGAIQGELTAPNSVWKERMSSAAFDHTLDKIDTLRKAANSQESTAARAALASVKQRNTDGVELDPAELAAVQDTVIKSKNPALMSEFAMVQRAQQIYRDNKGLPLDQQRAKIEEARKRGGITDLPEPVKQGINQGAALTNGQISTEYLAGIVNGEYGPDNLKSGDYNKPTSVVGKDGKPTSDARGVTQFISTTFVSTVRQHAAELGVDVAGKSDAEIAAMRGDPTLSIKAAALHALDNKRTLETSLGRPVNDGDLYFAHFLGANGAVRFLSAAQQNPNGAAKDSVAADQVEANHNVFYNEANRPRSNAEVRSLLANNMMNGASRVDYAGVKAATLVYNKTVQGLKDDPITYAGTTGRFGDVGSTSDAAGLQRRGVVTGQIAEYYKIPASELKPFTKSEAEDMARKVRDGTADDVLQVMAQVQALGTPEVVRAANKQIGEKDSLFGHAAGLAYNMPSQSGVAADIIRGEKRMKADKDLQTTLGETEPNRIQAFNKIVGKAVYGFDVNDASATTLRKAADALYAERFLARGSAKQGSFDAGNYEQAVQLVLGGGMVSNGKAIDTVNGKPMVLPPGMAASDFEIALERMGDNDYIASSKFGGPPRYADGSPARARDIAEQGTFVSLGGGEYTIRMSDGKELITAAYKDGSTNRYVFRANPAILRDIAKRPLAQAMPYAEPGMATP